MHDRESVNIDQICYLNKLVVNYYNFKIIMFVYYDYDVDIYLINI